MKVQLKDAVKNSGFFMEGYYVWCGSVVKENGIYYMFASRWKKETKFPWGYMTNSEIVLAKTEDLTKPFVFDRVIITQRPGGYWDSVMAHNPTIVKTEKGYYLYYIGSSDGTTETRAIGFAFAETLDGPWRRSDQPLALPADSNNPAVIKTAEGKVLLFFRDGKLKVSVAEAEDYEGPFRIVEPNVFPSAPIEDMFVFPMGSEYGMFCEDARGYFTGLKKGGMFFRSKDGIHWEESSAEKAYGFEIPFEDGTVLQLQRRERPMILFDEDKKYLFTACKMDGETILEGGTTGNMVQQIEF